MPANTGIIKKTPAPKTPAPKKPAPKKPVARAPTALERKLRAKVASLEPALHKARHEREEAKSETRKLRCRLEDTRAAWVDDAQKAAEVDDLKRELTQVKANVEQQKIHADGKLQGALLAIQALISKT